MMIAMMRKYMKKSAARFSHDETGVALIFVLVLLLLGSITIIPVLAYIGDALKTGQQYEEKSKELYTADSGVEDGLWRIKYDYMGPYYDAYDYYDTWPYETELVNGLTANVTIRNVWFPSNVSAPDPADARDIIESEKLVVVGTSGAIIGNPYSVKIDFTPDPGDNLTVKSLGVWLPQGFEYDTDSCSIIGGPFDDWTPDYIDVDLAPGGSTVVWGYNEPYPCFADFPDVDPETIPMTLDFTFGYTPPADKPEALPVAIAWITTDMTVGEYGWTNPNDVPVSWDVDTRFYEIVSNTGNTYVQAFTSKCELRQMGDAMSGDYVAIGGSLLADDDHDGNNMREAWHTPSSYDLNTIPTNADVVAAYLYWAGWRYEDAKETLLEDNCSDFDNWDRYSGGGSPTRVPTADGDRSGTWNYSPRWDDVDETTPNDSDYMTGTTDSGGYMLFTFDPFSIPPGTPIADLTVYVRARRVSGGNCNIRPSIKVDGTRYNTTASSNSPGSSWTTYSYSYTVNPDTGSPWTAEDLNGTGSHPLQQFGVYSSDLKPDVRVSMVYAEVNYGGSLWTISSGEFRGQGSGSATTDQRTLTLKNGMDLSGYAPGSIAVTWDQDDGGTLEEDDTLYFAFSADGGLSWSNDIEAFSDDNPDSPFSYSVPNPYCTSSDFKIRFYFNFDSSSEYVYIDNFEVLHLPIDTEVTFKIDGDQVYFDGSDPAIGPNPVVAGRSYVMLNELPTYGDYGFSYACTRDVTALVRAFTDEGDPGHYPGNALYTVDDIEANNSRYPGSGPGDSHLSHAGWSLIVVYASPDTAGHYIYIRDDPRLRRGRHSGRSDYQLRRS
jgi:Flp pilus assembly pilin Flp